ncbi:hypothetical protein PF010_g9139 [Phytophthora fragariae]|uniref:Uncharacterized protein n=1 Tax=Phytophthora fragariae TaxID=53985 RepID=A0A6G0LD07_9STRA|nr:hypothetical protein PF010_g9139 [Phytophthora fragariae]
MVWRGRKLWIETCPLIGTTLKNIVAAESKLHGDFCLEWLPYVEIEGLRLLTASGRAVNPLTAYRAICKKGLTLEDILHWTWSTQGNLIITNLLPQAAEGRVRRQLSSLMTLLVTNYPQLVILRSNAAIIRYTAIPVVVPPREFELDNVGWVRERMDTPPALLHGTASSHVTLRATVHAAVGGDVRVLWVHPHRHVDRMVRLWKGPNRGPHSWQAYKRILQHSMNTKGARRVSRGTGKWAQLSAEAAQGVEALRWTDIRRIVGLNPWGEQLRLRIKHHALSIFTPLEAGFCCPHIQCVNERRVTLHHIFWSCPAAAQLRDILVRRWHKVGMEAEDIEKAVFSLQLACASLHITTSMGALLDSYGTDAATQAAGGVNNMVAACWAIGAALYLQAVWRW